MTLLDILLFLAGKNGALAVMALFLLLSLAAIVTVGIHDGIEWFVSRGLRRRAERVGGQR